MPVIKKIQIRRDTAANWTAANPILASGEMGIETDTRKNKFGDGSSAWSSLAYSFGSSKSDIGLGNVDNTSDASKPVSTAQQTALNLKANDTAVVHNTGAETIAGVKTFSSAPIAPTPTNPTDVANKSYVDSSNANKQPVDSDLTDIAALSPINDDVIQRKAGVWINRTPAQVKTDLTLVKGDVGLGNVDNTSDINKPVSTAQASADSLRVLLTGDTMTGTLTTSGALVATGHYPSVPTTPGVYLGTPSTLNPRFSIVPLTGDVRAIDNSTGTLRFVNSTTGTVQLLSTGSGLFSFGTTNVPTHTLTLPSTSTGMVIYNTSDQTTNYQRLHQYYASGIAYIVTEQAGTGATTPIRLSAFGAAGTAFLQLNTGSTSGFVQSAGSSGFTGAIIHTINGTLSGTSGLQYGLVINPTLTQTVTGGYVALLVNVAETTVGSGTKQLIDLQVGSSSKLSVSSTGALNASSSITSGNYFRSDLGFVNATSNNNSRVQTLSSGTIIDRNVADVNTTLKVVQTNASATGDILQLQNSSGNMVSVNPTGTVFVANNTSVPGTNPVGGGYLYVESGALKYRGSSGTVTVVGVA
jgi:major tropism determinant Mtd-like protein/baseplate protein BppL